MSEVLEYKHREYVKAEKLDKDGNVYLAGGKSPAKTGDYLVYEEKGTRLVKGEDFERDFVLVEESVSEARKFSPIGKTVDVVLEFLHEHPDEVDRVKQEERDGGSRKGILEYEK